MKYIIKKMKQNFWWFQGFYVLLQAKLTNKIITYNMKNLKQLSLPLAPCSHSAQ